MITIERTLSQDEFDRFARLSGDDNPIHVDPAFAAASRFGRTVAHGALLTAILRGLAERLVPGGRQASQEAMFPAPTFAGEAMAFHGREAAREGAAVTLDLWCARVADGVETCRLRTVVIAP